MNSAPKQLIIIRGPVGAGKTSVVEALRSKSVNVSVIDFDAFKRQIDNSASSDWRREMALDTALYLCGLLMEKERFIIVDIHSSHRDQLDKYMDLAYRKGYNATSILLNPPLETCIERAKGRIVPGITYEIDEAMVQKYWNNTIFIDNEMIFDNPELSPDEIAAEIIKFMLNTKP